MALDRRPAARNSATCAQKGRLHPSSECGRRRTGEALQRSSHSEGRVLRRGGGGPEEPALDRPAALLHLRLGGGRVQEEVVEEQHVTRLEYWPEHPNITRSL